MGGDRFNAGSKSAPFVQAPLPQSAQGPFERSFVAVNVLPMPGCCVVQGSLERPVPFGFRWNLLIVCNFDMHGRMKRGPCS